MPEIDVLYFASCRDAVGRSSERLAVPDGTTVAALLEVLAGRHARLQRVLPTARVAVNREFREPAHVLLPGDEVVLIPPVSGGADPRVRLCHEPIARDAASAALRTDGVGAVVTFAGLVRRTSKAGRPVERLYYEAYEPMALEKLAQCLDEAAARWPLLDAAVVHRLGELALGEVAVSIGVASAHRQAAFEAAGYVIDRIKEIVPIWKKETGPDGSEWVSGGA